MSERFRYTETILKRAATIQKMGERGRLADLAREIGVSPKSLSVTLSRWNKGGWSNYFGGLEKEDQMIVQLISEGGTENTVLNIAKKVGFTGTDYQNYYRIMARLRNLGLSSQRDRFLWQLETNDAIREAYEKIKALAKQRKEKKRKNVL